MKYLVVVLLSVVVAACAGTSPSLSGGSSQPVRTTEPAGAATPVGGIQVVKAGSIASTTDAGLFVGMEKGYFAQEGIQVDFNRIDSLTSAVPLLASGQLDVAGGAINPGVFNAVGRDIAIKAVADKGSCAPGHGGAGIVVRKDLYDSGKIRSARDFNGVHYAATFNGSPEVNTWLEASGLSEKDLDFTTLSLTDIPVALANKSIDAGWLPEPFAAQVVNSGAGVRLVGCDEMVPNDQIGLLVYSSQFANTRTNVARRFMVAYLRGARDYNDAFITGRGGPTAFNDVVSILTRYTALTDPKLYSTVIMQGLNPNGEINVAPLNNDQDHWTKIGLQDHPVDLNSLIDASFAQAAVKELGPYR